MIDLTRNFHEAMNNLNHWRAKYPTRVYPHKIVLNMMYRAYSTRFVFEAFSRNELPEFDTFMEAIKFVVPYYGEMALQVHPKLEGWMRDKPDEQVGTICFRNYDNMATKAEFDAKSKEELEFSYAFELLCDMSVLYWISLRLCGESTTSAIQQMTDALIADIPGMDYGITKQVFQQLLVGRFMHEHYHPLP